MPKKIFTTLLMAAAALMASAQTYTEHVQLHEDGKSDVVLRHTSKLDSLFNGYDVQLITAIADSLEANTLPTDEAAATATMSKRLEGSVNHVYKKGEVVSVYSIQAFSGPNNRESKEKALSIERQVNAKFPGSGAKATFNSPRWIVIMGAYATQEAAQSMIKKMHNAGFTQAGIFRRTVIKK